MIHLRKILFLFLFLCFQFHVFGIELKAELFDIDESAIMEEFHDLNELEIIVRSNPEKSWDELRQMNSKFNILDDNTNVLPNNFVNVAAPGNIPSFWWAFSFGIVGSYTLYGAVAGPIAVAIVYFNTDKDKAETKKAIYGCLTGTVLGLGIRYVTSNML